ncbi:MAG: GNAT family N-acetyltransferase [Chloroflexi bacterium]|nr:GNAT family N-acetyltransferase [Chloroflexota bacterium]
MYQGFVPHDCLHQPYMPLEELEREMTRMTFFGWEEGGLVGIMGFQPVTDVTLIRHAYVRRAWQRRGIGSRLLNHLKDLCTTERLLVGTWASAFWAINFYQKHGFHLLANKDELLAAYWEVPRRQVESSVVLGISLVPHQ